VIAGRAGQTTHRTTHEEEGGIDVDRPMWNLGLLRDRRGDESVTFGELADRMEEYATTSPGDAHVVDRIAAFLAGEPVTITERPTDAPPFGEQRFAGDEPG
jgi:hypothetical protein